MYILCNVRVKKRDSTVNGFEAMPLVTLPVAGVGFPSDLHVIRFKHTFWADSTRRILAPLLHGSVPPSTEPHGTKAASHRALTETQSNRRRSAQALREPRSS